MLSLSKALLCLSAALLTANAFAGPYAFRLYAPGISQQTVSVPAAPSHTYATLNPNDRGANVSLSNGNLTTVSSNGSGIRATLGKSYGKWYFELKINTTPDVYPPVVGIASSATTLSDGWNGPSDFLFYGANGGQGIYGANVRFTYGSNIKVGDVIGVAVDLDNHQVTFYHNGVSYGVAYTSATLPAGTYYPFVSDPQYAGGLSTTQTLNFGQNPFSYTVPTGYNAGWYQ
jgi:hypothetical protein